MKIHKTTSLILVFATLASASLLAQVPGMLNYQGRVSVNGTNFTGSGLFKFALVGEAGPGGARQSLWSNDGTSTNGSEPSASVSIAAEKGLFSALIGGDGMQPVPASAFANDAVYLRVWFSQGGANAFEQLTPDQRIAAAGYAMKSTSADSATTVADGAITTAKLADNSITVDKVAPELIDAVLPAEGAVSGYSVLPSGPTTAEPNTKYLLPEDGAGILTLPTNPPVGAAIQVSGQGTIFANTNQLIGGLWFKTDTSRPGQYWQHFVSSEGRTVVSFNPYQQYSGSTTYAPRLRVLKIDGSEPQDYALLPTNNFGESGPMARLAVSADARTLFGSFYFGSNYDTYALYVSTNGAESWDLKALPDALTNFTRFGGVACSSDGRNLYAIASDQTIPTNRILRSSDQGSTWSTIDSIPVGYAIAGMPYPQLSVSGDGSTVMVTGGPNSYGADTLLISTNGGDTWLATNPANGMTNIQSWRPERATLVGNDGTIAVPARLSPGVAGNNNEALALLVSTNSGNSWHLSWDASFKSYNGSESFIGSSRSSKVIYTFGTTFNPGFNSIQKLSVLSSSDLGQSWSLLTTTEYDEGRHPWGDASNMIIASDHGGFQMVVARALGAVGTEIFGGLYLSAGNKLHLGNPDSNVELVYRGNGRWSILNSKSASSSIGLPQNLAP